MKQQHLSLKGNLIHFIDKVNEGPLGCVVFCSSTHVGGDRNNLLLICTTYKPGVPSCYFCVTLKHRSISKRTATCLRIYIRRANDLLVPWTTDGRT